MLARHLVDPTHGPVSLWWSAGSDNVEPTFLVFPGLPPADDYTWLLLGAPGVSEPQVEAEPEPEEPEPEEPEPEEPEPDQGAGSGAGALI